MNIQSIILCAGVGSRLKSLKSKILHEVCGRPMCYWPIKNAQEVSNLKPIVVVNYQAEAVLETLKKLFKDTVIFAFQEEPNGTAGAVKAALPHLDPTCQSVLVLCGDTPLVKKESLKKLLTIQTKSHVPVALLSAFAEDPTGYGRIVRNSAQHICGIVECQDATPLEREIKEVNPSIYVFNADFLRENIDKIKSNNKKNEYYLTDIVHQYIKNGAHLGPVGNSEISYEEMHGINDRIQLAYAQKVLNRRLLEQWMLDGVTFIDPDNTYIEEGVRLSKDVLIYPGVHLRGQSQVQEGAIIENGCVIINSVIERDVRLLPYTFIEQSSIGEKAMVGPFARLRPDVRLESEVKVGNFVEIKQSRLKRGTKAGHLAYIGDAEVGENCNIGAGTITCNYDGQQKHKTVIGDNAFIGSNATLIAPLTIGENAYIAGGSVITKEVVKDTLAIGRAHQVNKEKSKKPF